MRTLALLLAALTLATFVPSPAAAAALGCATGVTSTPGTGSVPTPFFTVTGAMGYVSTTLACGGPSMTSTAACGVRTSATSEFVVAGAYCGPQIAAKATVTCVYDALGLVAADTRLVVGFDLDGDGNVLAGEWLGKPVNGGVTFTNPYGSPAYVVGYPVSVTATTYPTDSFVLRCA